MATVRISKLTFQALALRESDRRRANARNFSFNFKLFKMANDFIRLFIVFQSRFDFSYYLSYLKYIIVNNMFSNSNLFCY